MGLQHQKKLKIVYIVSSSAFPIHKIYFDIHTDPAINYVV